MTGTSEVIWGHFCFEDGRRTLRDVVSDQTLQLTGTSAGPDHHFRYRDPDVDTSIVVSVIGETTFQVDFNGRHMRDVANDYALWRRLAFFLPDALPVWFNDAPSWSAVRLLGGWQNASWQSSFGLTSTVTHTDPVFGTNRSAPRWVDQLDLFPIDARPFTWHYVAPETVAPVIELKTIAGEVPRLDRTVPLEAQLANAPRFVRQDGNAALFLQHVGAAYIHEDYTPMVRYGYVNRKVVFGFSANRSSGILCLAWPMLVGADTPAGYFKDISSVPAGTRATESLELREELLFALIDIQGAMPPITDIPTIRKQDHLGYREIVARDPDEAHWMSDIDFGSYLDSMMDTPRRSPFGAAEVKFNTRWKFA